MAKINLFKAIKGKQELHILGTAHDVTIDSLPSAVINFVMSHAALVTESEDILKPITLEELKGYNFTLQAGNPSPLLGFDEHYQKTISKKIQTYLSFKNCNISIDGLNINGLYHLYQMSLYIEDGMDYSIIKAFLSKKISGLESRSESLNIMDINVLEEDFKALVCDTNRDKAHQNLFQLMKNLQYSKNLFVGLEDAPTCNELATRNSNWMPKIKSLDSSDIICVGVTHLFFENGILNKLKLDGYSIERMNSSYEFITASDEEILKDIKFADQEELQNMFNCCLEQLNPQERETIIKELMGQTNQPIEQIAYENKHAEEISNYTRYFNEGDDHSASEASELAGSEYQTCPYCGF